MNDLINMPNKSFYLDLLILDFDNVIYFNTKNDFSSKINEDLIKSATDLYNELIIQAKLDSSFNPYIILLTGRSFAQEELILTLLHEKGYVFWKTHFFIPNTLRSERQFCKLCALWKISIVSNYSTGEIYNKKIYVDDDSKILKELSKRRVNAEFYLAHYKYLKKSLCLRLKKIN